MVSQRTIRSSWQLFAVLLVLLVLTACAPEPPADESGNIVFELPDYMQQGYETYSENGGVRRPDNAVDVYVLYSPESQQYMPRIIAEFNRRSAEGNNPVTGQPYADGARPIYVHGQQPTTGSSGTAAQGIINAIIAPNNANVYHPTIFQPSVSHWLELVNFQVGTEVFDTVEAQATALSPVIIGMWESRVNAIKDTIGSDSIGWSDLLDVLNSPNGWQDYGIETGRRAVYYGHANPNVSSTGLSTNIAEYYACARENGFTERRLSLAAVNSQDVQRCVQDIERLVRHYSDSTENFLEYIARGPDYLDMIALEETDLICLNRGAQQGDRTCSKPQERLVAIYPDEGTFWHEHPFGVVNADWVTSEQQDAAAVFTEFVLTEDMQRIIMSEGFRPANPNVPLEAPFTEENGVDPAQPNTILDVPEPEAIISVQQNWSIVKKQADVMLVVDISGSMGDDEKLDTARSAIDVFLSGLQSNTRVGLLSFSDSVTIWNPLDNLEQNAASIRLHVLCQGDGNFTPPLNSLSGRCLQANGSTSLFTATRIAVDILDAASSPERIRAVIILSDGQDTCEGDGCSTLQDVVSKIERTRASENPVIVIPIAYGQDADINVLNTIARASATQVQSGDPASVSELLELLSSFF